MRKLNAVKDLYPDTKGRKSLHHNCYERSRVRPQNISIIDVYANR